MAAALAVLFLLPFLVFTNLHIIHNYYQYATNIFLILAVALALHGLSENIAAWKFACICMVVVSAQVATFFTNYFPSIKVNANQDGLNVARCVLENTSPASAILVAGCDWNPVIGYYSQRKALYLPVWASEESMKRILKNPEAFTNGLPVEAFVEYKDSYPVNTDFWRQQAGWLESLPCVYNVGNYRVFLRSVKGGSNVQQVPLEK